MKKSSIRIKQPISLRAKELKGGRKSLYLDYYQEGSKNHAHKYEFLKLYLLPETSKENREANRNTMQGAEAILRQRLAERTNKRAGLATSNGKVLVLDYYEHYYSEKKRNGLRASSLYQVSRLSAYLEEYNPNIYLCDIDKYYVLGFIQFLKTCKSKRNYNKETTISSRTAGHIYNYLNAMLSYAVSEGIINENPCKRITTEQKRPLRGKSREIEYLTADEVARLEATPTRTENVRRAFLFGCFTGLRISDIERLQWHNIVEGAEGRYININMQKTSKNLMLPLSERAGRYLPPMRREGKVFDLPLKRTINKSLKALAKRAGIDKNVHFHVSRHTFATLLLTKGVDLYTVSKLLGHKNIATTQIYAEIINSKKTDAVNALNDL